jgi:hypothetical protein
MQLVRRNLDLEGSVKICEGKMWGKYKYRSSDKGTQSSDMPHCARLDFGNTFNAEVPTVSRDKE